jgi:hypothetical protein
MVLRTLWKYSSMCHYYDAFSVPTALEDWQFCKFQRVHSAHHFLAVISDIKTCDPKQLHLKI